MNKNRLQQAVLSNRNTVSTSQLIASRVQKVKSLFAYSLAFLLISGLGLTDAMAQDRIEITGTVTDETDGSSLPGATINALGSEELTGSLIGTTTDMQGNYSLEVPEELNVLEVSFVGYVSQEIEINGRTTINVQLEPDVTILDDLVVVGYGTQERRQITGSVSSVSAEDFNVGNVNHVGELIQGKVTGLNITRPGSNPNERPTMRLRGVSSFGGALEPLIVVDGIVGASLDNIDPNDIESIDVMKDASASAIYGTRGGAGVIAITTKRGQRETAQVSYNGSMSVQGIENRLDVLNADQFRELSETTGFQISDFGHDTDWYDEITQTGYTQIHNLALSGGTESTTYRVSGNFRDNRGILRTTGFEQLGGRVNLNHNTLDDRLSLTFDLGATNRQEDRGFDHAFQYATTFNPTAPVRADGFEDTGGFREIAAFDMFNPVAILETAENVGEERNLNFAMRGEYFFDQLLPGLSANILYSIETESLSEQFAARRVSKSHSTATQARLGRGHATRYSEEARQEQFDVTATYTGNITDQFSLELLGGYSFQEFQEGGTFVGGGDFVSDRVGAANLSYVQDFEQGLGDISSFENINRLIAGFSRLSLNWDETYFFNATIRREGSSRFGAENQWGNFWSAGAGSELTNVVNLGFFDQFRIRGSYGLTGLDAPFDGISQLRFGPVGNFFVGGEFIQAFGPISNPNPDLKWEESREFTIGAEFALLDERMEGNIEYFEKTTEDLIFEIDVPVPPNLFSSMHRNVGSIENKGFEAMLNYDVIRSPEMNWNTGVTFSMVDIFLAEFETDVPRYIANVGAPGQNATQQVRLREGEPLGQLWGPRFAGIDDDGRWKFYNDEGDRVASGEIAREDEAVIGNAIPDFEMGWDNSFRYQNWNLNLFFRGVYGHDLVNHARVFFENPTNITTYNIVDSGMELTELVSEPRYSSFHVEDASFIRLENISLGYNVPVANIGGVNRLRLSVSGRNLFTLTGYNGIDPEVRWEDNGNPLAPGIERRQQWFTARSVTFGVNIDF